MFDARSRHPADCCCNVVQTLSRVWTVEYDWPPFCIALGMSVIGIFVGSALEHIARAIAKRPLDPRDPLEVCPPACACYRL
jgi:uncharacterized membrane protein YfcA